MLIKMKNMIFFIFLTILEVQSKELLEGDTCVLPNNRQGKCTIIHQCPKALEELKSGATPSTCEFSGNDPVVCCDVTITNNMSEEMCKKYGKQLKKYQVHSVVGGEDAIATEFPHMAALGYGTKEKIEWLCGGSLISEHFVLTAAHCMKASIGEVKFVRMGDIRLDGTSSDGQNFEIIRRILHPNYKPPSTYNDIALVELNKPAIFSIYVKPACLYSKPLDPQMTLVATGWGLMQFAGEQSLILQKVNLKLFNHAQCSNAYRTSSKRKLPNGILEDSQMCAGSDEEKDTCQGDSGGPLQVYRFQERLYGIAGTTSFGKTCGTAGVPSVYSKVAYYVPWIESVVWP